jgi:hypothetical protein
MQLATAGAGAGGKSRRGTLGTGEGRRADALRCRVQALRVPLLLYRQSDVCRRLGRRTLLCAEGRKNLGYVFRIERNVALAEKGAEFVRYHSMITLRTREVRSRNRPESSMRNVAAVWEVDRQLLDRFVAILGSR